MRALAIGSLSLDLIDHEGREERRLGGVVTYASLTYARLGLEAAAVFNVADADRAALAPLAAAGVALHAGPSRLTTVCVNRVRGEERRQEMPALARPIAADAVTAALAGVDLVHLGPLHPADLEVACRERLAAAGLPLALDLQGLVRHVEPDGVKERLAKEAEAFLAGTWLVKGSEAEVGVLARALGAAAEELPRALGIEELVVTRGARGGRVHLAAGAPIEYDAPAVAAAGDATGAGDVFLAAYAASRLARALEPAAAAREAAAVAARHVAGEWIPPASLRLG